jgi:uncharacterized protein YbjT (DUF2867 family)
MTVKRPYRNVCVLGGTGFVGKALVNELVRRDYRVTIPTRSRQRHRELLVFPGVDVVTADIHDERVLTHLVTGADVIVNLVGILNEKGHDGGGFKHAHVDLVEKLLRACSEAKVGRLIHMSALKANAERGPSHYLRTKGQAEQLIRAQRDGDLRYTIFKPSVIYGPGDSFINRFAGLLHKLPVLPLACADARMSPVYVDDVALAFLTAIEDSRCEDRIYELCGPDIYSLGEIVDYVKRQLRLRRAIWPLPKPLGRLQAAVADYAIPGKPFSLDNFASLGVAGVCGDDGFANLGIVPRAMTTIVPGYLRSKDR